MYYLLTLMTFWVLTISFIIAIYSNIFVLKKNYSFRDYLFKHNSPFKAIFSNGGSLLSLTTLIGIFIPAIIGWGISVIMSIILGVWVGYCLFLKTIFCLNKQSKLPIPLSEKYTNTLWDVICLNNTSIKNSFFAKSGA